MTPDFLNAFEKADAVVHSVEKEWHYPILTEAGYSAVTLKQTGFVRRYRYEHPTRNVIIACTGMNADYWEEEKTGKFGYWNALKTHISEVTA